MGNVIGESLSRILESNGTELKRNNYQGDVGLHIGKAIWGIIKSGGIIDGTVSDKTKYIGEAYASGSLSYEDDPVAREEIKDINKKVFEKSDEEINKIYKWGRGASLEHFEELYKKLGTKFDFYFFESEVADSALTIVKEFLKKGLFEESEGAIVFRGENFDPKLHTRVFVTKQGLPMYEAKDIAHAIRKYDAYKFDKSIIITANEQDEYFKVMLRALKEINPKIAESTMHLSHGILKLTTGKMGSRKGNIITGEALIDNVESLVKEKIKERGFDSEESDKVAEIVAIGAIKYSILRQAIGGDIIFDFDKSLSFEGDSGPYLQYTYVRANSVIQNSKFKIEDDVFAENSENVSSKRSSGRPRGLGLNQTIFSESFQNFQRPDTFEVTDLEKYLYRFPEVVEQAGREYAPHLLVTYLTELASLFNSFYANTKIIDESDSSYYKLSLTQSVATILKNGLRLLGIKVPNRM
jgi:arginyl-tRNA synthetase